jgi:hypothetical protein
MDNKWVILTSTGEFKYGGYRNVAVPLLNGLPDANYSIVEIADDITVSPRLHKWSGGALVNKSQAEIDAYDLAIADTNTDAYYKNKDVLAMCAVILEKTDPAFTTTDTNAQKRTKVVACAVRFNQERKWVERNYALMSFPANP